MPLTLVASDPVFQSDTLFNSLRDRRTMLSWADSVIGEAFIGRGPGGEVGAAAGSCGRSPGARRASSDDPDQMGQALSCARPKLKDHPRSAALVAPKPRGDLRRPHRHDPRRARLQPRYPRRRARRSEPGARRRALGQGAVAERRDRHRRTPLAAALDAALAAVLPLDSAHHDVRRHPHPGRRHRSRDHRPDGEGARGHRAPVQLGRRAGRAWRRSMPPARPLPDATVDEHPEERASPSRARSRRRSAPGSAR